MKTDSIRVFCEFSATACTQPVRVLPEAERRKVLQAARAEASKR